MLKIRKDTTNSVVRFKEKKNGFNERQSVGNQAFEDIKKGENDYGAATAA